QIARFASELAQRAHCKPETLKAIESLPHVGAPMDLFAASLLVVGLIEGTGDYREDCLHVIAKIPQVAATVINSRAGWRHTPTPKPEIGYIENFVHMLQMPGPTADEFLQVKKLFNVLHYDHCGG